MHKTIPFAVLLGVLLPATRALAQSAPIKFGQVDPKDLTAAPFVGDSAAAAVVLCDYGATRFEFINNQFQLVSERTTRIKILKKAGYEAATVKVPLYHQGENSEKISGLRGLTTNLVDGKVAKTKLDLSTSAFSEDVTPHVRVRKFTLPDVREGSVIDYTYTVVSDFFTNFQDWTFQGEYPVRWSEFRADIPEYFQYRKAQQGYHMLAVQTEEDNAVQFNIHMAGSTVGSGFNTTHEAGSNETVTARQTRSRWVMKDVPAFRDEPYMTTAADYVDRLNFQLAGVRFPGQPYQPVAGTWAKVEMELLNDENFGMQLDRAGFLKDQLQPLVARYPNAADRAAAVRALV
ncbi:DUF3857 domain-containing protein, partial [Hymenobacter agri]